MQSPSPSKILLEWQALDVHPHKRSSRWYMLGGIFILMFAAYGLWEGSWLMALVAILIGGMYFLMRNTAPRKITIRITAIGVQVEENVTPWNQLKDFWILLGPDYSELHFAPQGMAQRELKVFIRDPQTTAENAPDPGMIRETLLQFLPERPGMQERFLDSLARILKL